MVVRITLLRDRLAHVIGEVIVVLDADVLVDAARGAARTARPHALDEGKPSRVHKCREVVGRLSLFLDAGVLGELRAQHAVVDDPNSGHDGGGGCHVISGRRDEQSRTRKTREVASTARSLDPHQMKTPYGGLLHAFADDVHASADPLPVYVQHEH